MKKMKFLLLLILVLVISGCKFIKVNINIGNNETNKVSKNEMANTTWRTSTNSEVVFTDDRITWYQSADNHNDNYYSGTYKYYRGSAAVKYITEDLSEYGVTKDELNALFIRNESYDESNFVVFDIRYDTFILSGRNQEISRPLVPWYGFILQDGTILDVANMNTAAYYKFTKVN